jgi:hypothetical protein
MHINGCVCICVFLSRSWKEQPARWDRARRTAALVAAFGEHLCLSYAAAIILPEQPWSSGFSMTASERALSRTQPGGAAAVRVWGVPYLADSRMGMVAQPCQEKYAEAH